MAKRLSIDVEAFADDVAKLYVRTHSIDEFRIQIERLLAGDRRGGISADKAARQARRDECLATLWQVVAGDARHKADAARRTIESIERYRDSGEFEHDRTQVWPREVGFTRALMGAILLTKLPLGQRTVENAIAPTWIKKRKSKRPFEILYL
ncbi:MAG: hypothetical protein KBA31_00145 [Alphaproteobacteria bacterium]|nr:hypothetical protein [Alphaproteobacteria bacterium]